jgi:hypothetical protein
MLSKIKKIPRILLNGLLILIVSLLSIPYLIIYIILKTFWKMFGTLVVSFIIIGLLGGTVEECLTYSSGLAFFVGVLLSYKTK